MNTSLTAAAKSLKGALRRCSVTETAYLLGRIEDMCGNAAHYELDKATAYQIGRVAYGIAWGLQTSRAITLVSDYVRSLKASALVDLVIEVTAQGFSDTGDMVRYLNRLAPQITQEIERNQYQKIAAVTYTRNKRAKVAA